jgi:hypothetical protein
MTGCSTSGCSRNDVSLGTHWQERKPFDWSILQPGIQRSAPTRSALDIGIASSHIAMSSGSIVYISISSVTAKTRIRYLLQGGTGTISNAAATPRMSLQSYKFPLSFQKNSIHKAKGGM